MRIAILSRAAPVRRRMVARLARAMRRGEQRLAPADLVVVGDGRSRELNRQFLGHDWATDVIAFEPDEESGAGAEPAGEIIINASMARREGRRRGHGAEAELLFYVAHGLLHLLGYDDATPAERASMHARQARYLRRIGVRIHD